jgi:tetratricopeptide (TPR) repeat protein
MKYKVLILLIATTFCAEAQPLKELYRETLEMGDTALQMQILTGWEEMRPNDPELCIIQADRYFKISRHRKAKVDSLPYFGIRANLLDDTSPRSKPSFYLVKYDYEAEPFTRAIDYLTRSIIANPDHIDLRLKKITFLKEYRSSSVTKEVLDLIERAKINKNVWLVEDSTPWDAHDTLLPFLQRTSRQIFTTGIAGHEQIRQIGLGMLELYPDHHQSLVDVGRSYYLSQDFGTALKYFKRAEEIMPHSLQALGYSALCYYYLGKHADAVTYFYRFKEYGDEEDRLFADARILELSSK